MYSIEKDEIRRKIIVQATGIFKIVGMLAQRIYISDTVEKTAPAIVLQQIWLTQPLPAGSVQQAGKW